jgi:hypothetical protein
MENALFVESEIIYIENDASLVGTIKSSNPEELWIMCSEGRHKDLDCDERAKFYIDVETINKTT